METQISKKNAIIILDNVLRQQSLVEKIEKIAHVVIDEYNGGFGTIEPLFNIDFTQLSILEYEMYFDAFFGVLRNESLDFNQKAHKLYSKILEIKDYQQKREETARTVTD